ncbi:hypothetical protein PCANC_03182 [Puccinia coronata f. sp. avenae]|uniref:Uncharacterized protein n=1 Tax=Puccinia coronata f. sp. avenae TaxID=200324 RepID=A0A2N5T861_9BASI|nr:hypothetical protein PCANC_03182 [Puccinia coronata f. sp. avenae]
MAALSGQGVTNLSGHGATAGGLPPPLAVHYVHGGWILMRYLSARTQDTLHVEHRRRIYWKLWGIGSSASVKKPASTAKRREVQARRSRHHANQAGSGTLISSALLVDPHCVYVPVLSSSFHPCALITSQLHPSFFIGIAYQQLIEASCTSIHCSPASRQTRILGSDHSVIKFFPDKIQLALSNPRSCQRDYKQRKAQAARSQKYREQRLSAYAQRIDSKNLPNQEDTVHWCYQSYRRLHLYPQLWKELKDPNHTGGPRKPTVKEIHAANEMVHDPKVFKLFTHGKVVVLDHHHRDQILAVI